MSLPVSFRRGSARYAAFELTAVSKGFKSYFYVSRFTSFVLNNFWHPTISV